MRNPKLTMTTLAKSKHVYDVFLSHHSSDKPQVEMIAARLEDEEGLKPFLDKWHLIPGQPWQEELEAALDQSATCAVFLGPKGLGAWENEEMRSALDDRVRNKDFRVIPVLLPGAAAKDDRTLPRFLRRLTWVDFRAGLDDPEAFQRLAAGIRGQAPGRSGSPLPVPAKPRKYGKWAAVAVIALLLMAAWIIYTNPQNRSQVTKTTTKAATETATLSGTVLDQIGQPIRGALVTLDDLPGMKSVETDSDGKFTIKDIPKPYGEDVKIRIIKDGYQPNPYTEGNIVLGKSPPRITLTREMK